MTENKPPAEQERDEEPQRKGNHSVSSDIGRRTFLRITGSAGIVGSTTALAGCFAGEENQTTAESPAERGTQTPTSKPSEITTGGELVIALQSEPGGMNPHQPINTSGQQLVRNFGNSLMDVDSNGDLYPDLATEMPEVSDDGTTYVFTLPEGVQFHEPYKRELTAEDVVENFHKILDADYGSPARGDFEGLLVGDGINPQETVRATGTYEVTFTLEKPFADFLYKVATSFTSFIPMESYEEHGDDLGTVDTGIWATGPFQFVEAASADHYTFERNPDYFRETEAGQLPYVDKITFRIIPEDSVRITGLKTGEIDISEQVPATDVKSLRKQNNVKIKSRPGGSRLTLWINQRHHEPFTKKAVRKAMGYAHNEEALIQTKFKGLAAPPTGPFPPWHWAYDEESVTTYPHDVEEAKSLLEDAGYGDGFQMKCQPTNQPLFVDTAQILQQSLSDVGIDLQITPKEKSAAFEPLFGKWGEDPPGPPPEWHSMVEDLSFSFDADSYAHSYRTNGIFNFAYYSDDQVDQWIDKARTATDQAKRKELYANVQQKVTEDIPEIWQTWWNTNQGLQANVQNFNVYPNFALHLERVWLKQS